MALRDVMKNDDLSRINIEEVEKILEISKKQLPKEFYKKELLDDIAFLTELLENKKATQR